MNNGMHELELETVSYFCFSLPVLSLALRKDGELGKDYFLVLALGEGKQLGLETCYTMAWPFRR